MADLLHFVDMSSRLTKKSLRQRARPAREHAVRRPARCWRSARACRRPARSSPARSASAGSPGRPASPPASRLCPSREVVAEAVGRRLEHGERRHVGLRLRGVGAARREGHLHVDCPAFRPPARSAALPPSTIRSASEIFLPPACARLKSFWIALELLQHLGQLGRIVDRPILLRREADARAVGAAAHVGAAERGGRSPGRADQLGHGQARGEDLRLQRRDVVRVDQRMVDAPGPGPARSGPRAALRRRGSARAGPCRDASA